MSNPFYAREVPLVGPAIDYVPVTPNDTTDLADVAVAVYVETGGVLEFVSLKGQTRAVTLPDFGWLLCGVRRIRAENTTAAGIFAIVQT